MDKNIYRIPKYCAIVMAVLGLPSALLGHNWLVPIELAIYGYGVGLIVYGMTKVIEKYTYKHVEEETQPHLEEYKKSVLTQWYRQGTITQAMYDKLMKEVNDGTL